MFLPDIVALAIKLQYEFFKKECLGLAVDGKVGGDWPGWGDSSGGGNTSNQGGNNGTNNNGNNSGNNNSNGSDTSSGLVDALGRPIDSNGNPIVSPNPNINNTINALKNWINPNCPIHGQHKKRKCPICGHTDCGCGFYDILNDDGIKYNPPKDNGYIKGDEINADNWNDLKNEVEKLHEQEKNDNNNNDNGGNNGDSSGGINVPYTPGWNKDPASKFLDLFSQCIDAGCQFGVPTLPNLMIRTAMGTLWIKKRSNPILFAVEIALKVMLYWSTCILPIGTPVQGPISVVVPLNTASLALPFALDILRSGQNAQSQDYSLLCSIIYNYSAEVQWQVTEINPATGAPVPFIVMVT